MPHRLDPPGIDAGRELGCRLEMRKKSSLVDDLAAGEIDEDGVALHERQLAPAKESLLWLVSTAGSAPGHPKSASKRSIDDVAPIQSTGSSVTPRRLMAWTLAPSARIKPRCGDPNAAKAQNAANGASQHTVGPELIERTIGELCVLDEQSFHGGKRHHHGMLGHGLGIGAPIASDWQVGRQIAQRNIVHTSCHKLHEASLTDQRSLTGPKFCGCIASEQTRRLGERLCPLFRS